jgi:ElaB/YqjD/DUF883 family membrane-anchored ribosome-binding protein
MFPGARGGCPREGSSEAWPPRHAGLELRPEHAARPDQLAYLSCERRRVRLLLCFAQLRRHGGVVAFLSTSLAEEENADQLLNQVARSRCRLPKCQQRLNSPVRLSRRRSSCTQAAGAAQDLYGQAKDAARTVGDAATKYAKDAYENNDRASSEAVAQKVQQNPLGALLIAGCIGFVLALLMTRQPRWPPPRLRNYR